MSQRLGIVGVAVGAMLLAGCLVEVREVRDPRPAFDDARDEARRAEDRGGHAHELNVLAWDPAERKLVRLQVPIWLVLHAHGDVELSFDDDCERHAARLVRRHVHRHDLEHGQPGILVDVREDDGERALVWLR
jgi:hypothetical protein